MRAFYKTKAWKLNKEIMEGDEDMRRMRMPLPSKPQPQVEVLNDSTMPVQLGPDGVEEELYPDLLQRKPDTTEDQEKILGQYLELQEEMAKIIAPLQEIRKLRLKAKYQRVINQATLKSVIKKADDKVLELEAKLQDAKNGKHIPRQQWNALVHGIAQWRERAKQLCHKAKQYSRGTQEMWDHIHSMEAVLGSHFRWEVWKLLQAEAKTFQGDKKWLYPKYRQLAEEPITPYNTYGEVKRELDDTFEWDKNINAGEELAKAHIAEMERINSIINAPIKKSEEPGMRTSGYVPPCKHWKKEDEQSFFVKEDDYSDKLLQSVELFLNS